MRVREGGGIGGKERLRMGETVGLGDEEKGFVVLNCHYILSVGRLFCALRQ